MIGRIALAAWLLGTASIASAQTAADAVPTTTTAHRGQIGGRIVAYTVTAGRLPIRDMESGTVHGRIFYTAFAMPPRAGERRPVMFVWGGGPSGPSLGMQLVYGPIHIGPDGALADTPNSLLAAADLVFVDPIGTGFSRAEAPGSVKEYYSTTGDARSIAEFIRVWLALNRREDAPLFVAGQSYGTWRAAIVAEMLEKAGRRVNGVIMTSGGMGAAGDYLSKPEEIAMRVPDYAATALFHHRLDPAIGTDMEAVRAQAERWARERYLPALVALKTLPEADRAAIAAELARYTGYPLAKIDPAKLSFTPRDYLRDFPGKDGAHLDTYDMRVIEGGTPAPRDPAAEGRHARAQSRYLREFVGSRTDLAYIGVEPGYTPITQPDYQDIGERWQWDSILPGAEASEMASAMAGEGPPGNQPWALRTIAIDPAVRYFIETGIYDSLNYCRANTTRQSHMPPAIARAFELHCYYAGHGTFRDPKVNPLVMEDLRRFVVAAAR